MLPTNARVLKTGIAGDAGEIANLLTRYASELTAYLQSRDNFERTYAIVTVEGQAILAELVALECLRNGILLSSDTLHANLEQLKDASVRRSASRREQIERGALRYLTRAVMKATPFASPSASS